jgi:hypothetical protein
VRQIFHSSQPSRGGDRTTFEVMTSTQLRGTLGLVASLLAATLYQGIPDMNHKLRSIVSTERYILNMQVLFSSNIWVFKNSKHNFAMKEIWMEMSTCS